MRKDGNVGHRHKPQNDARIYLHMDNSESDETQIDLMNIAGHMKRKKRLYRYVMAIAACAGILIGLIEIGRAHV